MGWSEGAHLAFYFVDQIIEIFLSCLVIIFALKTLVYKFMVILAIPLCNHHQNFLKMTKIILLA